MSGTGETLRATHKVLITGLVSCLGSPRSLVGCSRSCVARHPFELLRRARDPSGAVRGRVGKSPSRPRSSDRRLPDRQDAGWRADTCRGLILGDCAVGAGLSEEGSTSPGRRAAARARLSTDIDVHGRKVVRVNDVELDSTPLNGCRGHHRLWTSGEARSAGWRKVPVHLACPAGQDPASGHTGTSISSKRIGPARQAEDREGLSRLHPADTLTSSICRTPRRGCSRRSTTGRRRGAGGNDPHIQVSIVESLDSNWAADIAEEMDRCSRRPAGRPLEARSGAILKEMT